MPHTTKPALWISLVFLALSGFSTAQQSSAPVPAVVPQLVNFYGRAVDAHGKVTPGVSGVTFAIYSELSGGSPLWIETQNVSADARGNFTAQLGATRPTGLPADLFTSGGARWLSVRIDGGEEQPRVLLLSVPYAIKAEDAATLGGLPPSAFLLAVPANPPAPAPQSATPAANGATPSTALTGSGSAGNIPVFDSASDVISSAMTQTGTGSAARIGINTTSPGSTLDVKGVSTFRGTLGVPSAGLASASTGRLSYPLVLTAAAFNSTTTQSVSQNFRWQAEPVGNNTVSPTGTLNLLFNSGSTDPAETGFRIASNGVINFAAGQTFPGTGTISAVTAGTGLTGGGSSGSVTLNIDATKVAQLNSANTFTGNQTVNGNLSATGVVTGSSYQIGSDLFAFGSKTSVNAYLGFAGNATSTGTGNTGVGVEALALVSSGEQNTAVGTFALFGLTTGSANTALGLEALENAGSSSSNTAVGAFTLPSSTGGANTALGANALQSNITGSNNLAAGAQALFGNTTGTNNTAVGFNSLTDNVSGNGNTAVGEISGLGFTGSEGTFLGAGTLASPANLTNVTAIGTAAIAGESNSLILGATGSFSVSVGIGTSTPFSDYGLTVDATNNGGAINGGIVTNGSGGNLYLGMTKGVHKFRVDTNGVAYADGGYQSSGADFAESVAVRGSRSAYEPGDVLEIDRSARRGVMLSRHPYATLVAGIYSTKPGLLATPHNIDDPAVKTTEVPLAIVGIVPCKVTTENGSIAPGDLLVTSSRPGYAMKGTDRRRMLGSVVGKALEPLAKGNGVIQVLVTLQ